MNIKVTKDKPVICWVSGGVTSAVACKIAQDIYPHCRFIFIDTKNEDDDSYRFIKDLEVWYGQNIEHITNEDYSSIQEVWRRYNGMNFAHGAICSTDLKRVVRERWARENEFSYQVFGFDVDEIKRVKGMKTNYPEINPIFPLLLHSLSKKDCIKIVSDAGIQLPAAYRYGFLNNNCLKTGCVQGGIGYWQKMRAEFPDKFDKMAAMEHELTERKGSPVTMLKDQSKDGGKVFLKHNHDYPNMKDISMMKGRPPKPLTDCNGFCGINDLEERSETEMELSNEQLSIW